jgi:hypothetical protein
MLIFFRKMLKKGGCMALTHVSVPTWERLLDLIVIESFDILEITVCAGKGVEDLAVYLDTKLPGLLETWSRGYVEEVTPLLEEALPFTAEVKHILADPLLYFLAETKQDARDDTVAHFASQVTADSAEHIKRAMTAFIELGLGNFYEASNFAEFAVCEKEVINFREKFTDWASKEAKIALLQTQTRKAEILIDVIKCLRGS